MTVESIDDLRSSLSYHLRAKNRAPETCRQYGQALAKFAGWLETKGQPLDLPAISTQAVEQYIVSLATDGGERKRTLSQSTIRYHYAGLRAVFRWHAKREGYQNPMQFMDPPKVDETQKDIVSVEDAQRVLRHLDQAGRYRDAAIISLLIDDGLRASELCALLNTDVDWKKGLAVIRHTKNGDMRLAPLLPATLERLDTWRAKRRDKSSPCLFTGQSGGPLTIYGLYQLVRRTFTECGIPNIGPHDLRHSMATAYMNNPEARESDLKVVGGWRSDSIVRRYSKKGKEDRAMAAFRVHSPMANR